MDRVRELVDQNLPESLTLEYKEKYSSSLVTSVAAMANSYGGIILVGVTDQPRPDRVLGVPDTVVIQIVNACHDKLEPPWEPEIIPVQIAPGGDSYVLVVRVDPARAPRPLLIDGAAPIRLQGRNAKADRDRLARLFSESSAPAQSAGRLVTAPQMPAGSDGSPAADFIVRTGIVLPVGEAATWRPLSERGVDLLATALNASPVHQALLHWANEFGMPGFTPFRRLGFNRARHARLVWQVAAPREPRHPIEAIAELDLPAQYGTYATAMSFTLDVLIRANAYLAGLPASVGNGGWRLPLPDLYGTLDGMLATLTSRAVLEVLAGLADVDPVVVPQPGNLFLETGPEVSDLLYPQGLVPVEDAGLSHGAHVLANPGLDLSDPAERQSQLDDWLQQIALDAGLRGMENLLAAYHRQEAVGT